MADALDQIFYPVTMWGFEITPWGRNVDVISKIVGWIANLNWQQPYGIEYQFFLCQPPSSSESFAWSFDTFSFFRFIFLLKLWYFFKILKNFIFCVFLKISQNFPNYEHGSAKQGFCSVAYTHHSISSDKSFIHCFTLTPGFEKTISGHFKNTTAYLIKYDWNLSLLFLNLRAI